jgi:hypothetical protein
LYIVVLLGLCAFSLMIYSENLLMHINDLKDGHAKLFAYD